MANINDSTVNAPIQKKQSLTQLPPPLYAVKFLNDNATTFDFVVWILVDVFQQDFVFADQFAQEVHMTGSALIGAYTSDVAKTKVQQVHDKALLEGFPLQCEIEPLI